MPDVTMPQLGETVTEGTITRWAKKVGDTIAADEVLFEVSTDKVDSEVPSPAAGVLSEIKVQEGDTVDVGTVLAIIGSADQGTGGSADQGTGGSADQGTGGSADQGTGGSADQGTGGSAGRDGEAAAEPRAELDGAGTVEASSKQEETTQQNPAPAPSPTSVAAAGAAREPRDQEPGAPSGEGNGKVLSPIVRKMINEAGLDAGSIAGTGAGGRITRDDVQKAIAAGGSAPAPAPSTPAPVPAAAPAPPSRPAAPRPVLPPAIAGERDAIVPFSNIRKRTAEHMTMSKSTSAHTLVTIEVDYYNVDQVRKKVKNKFKADEGVSLTYLPFITRALVDAIREFPYVNASVGNNELIVHRDVNVGIAVDLDFEGLLVPVLHGADGLRLAHIARGIADVAHRARNKKLQADDIAGGTFTVTNAGGYGTFITYPVINQPQVAILSTDGVKKRPVAIELPDGTDAVAVHPTGLLGLAWDHRAFDGAYASAFMAKLKEVLETRDWSGEL